MTGVIRLGPGPEPSSRLEDLSSTCCSPVPNLFISMPHAGRCSDFGVRPSMGVGGRDSGVGVGQATTAPKR
jgi:hypothetical protein